MTELDQDNLADAIVATVKSTCDGPVEAVLILTIALAKIFAIGHRVDANSEEFIFDHAQNLRELINFTTTERVQ